MSDLASSSHPSVEKLRGFGLGQLDPGEASAVEEHVSQCETCCRALSEVGPDTLVELLRNGRKMPEAAHELETVALTKAAAEAMADLPVGGEVPYVGDLAPALVNHPRYRVLALLGAGGMGAVYKAEHRLMDRLVALKVMAPSLLGSPAMIERFRREVKAAARLSHPNIVTAHDAEKAGELHLLVMEYVEGKDLAGIVTERGPLPFAHACNYIRQAATGLQHAHEHGMIHRDIKPHNLMLTPQGVIKILDFGLARLAGDASSQPGGTTAQGMVLGTVDYMAPEQADNAHQADIRSDIYSLGCTLYHLLSGRPPFPKGTIVQKIMAHTERQAPPLRELSPDIPPGLARIVERMMAKPPRQRYQTPDEVRIALRPFAESGAAVLAGGGRTDRVPQRKRRPPRREVVLDALPASDPPRQRWPLALGLLALLLGGLIAAAVAVYRIQTDNGELVISTDDPDVEVVIKQNGKVVRIIDTKTGKEVKLDSGRYELELKDKAEGLKLSPQKFTLSRGETVVAKVELLRKQDSVSAKLSLPPAEIRRDVFNGSENVPAHVLCVSFAPSGRYFLAAGDAGNRSPVRIYDGTTGKFVSEFVPEGEAGWSVGAFSPDGTKVVSWFTNSSALFVWEPAAGKQLLKLEGHKETVTHAAFSPDAKRIVSGSKDHTLRVWDAATGKELLVLEGHTDNCSGCFSPDGKWIVSGSADNTVRGWDAATGKEVWKQTEQALADCLRCRLICFSPDGAWLLTRWGDAAQVSETATGKVVSKLKGPDEVIGASFLPDGRQVMTWGNDKVLRLWSLPDGKEVRSLELGEDLFTNQADGVTVSPDGRFLLTSHPQTVRLCELATGKELHRYTIAPRQARSMTFSPDGRFVASGSWRGWVYLWRLPAPAPEKVGEIRRFEGHEEGIDQVALSPDGRLAASGSADRTARLWDVASGKELHKLEGHTSQVYSVAFRPNGRQLLTGSEDMLLKLWDVDSGKEIRSFEGHTGTVTGVAFSPDGKHALSNSWDQTLRLWDVETGKELRKFEGHTEGVQCVAFSPDGKRAVSGSFDRTIRIWDVDKGVELCKFEGHTAMVRSVAYSPDGRRILSGAWEPDGTLRLWDVETVREIRQMRGIPRGIHGVAFSPDGCRALVGGQDTDVQLWDLETGQLLYRLRGHTVTEGRPFGFVSNAVFSSKGRYALSGGADKTLRLWRLPAPPAK